MVTLPIKNRRYAIVSSTDKTTIKTLLTLHKVGEVVYGIPPVLADLLKDAVLPVIIEEMDPNLPLYGSTIKSK